MLTTEYYKKLKNNLNKKISTYIIYEIYNTNVWNF